MTIDGGPAMWRWCEWNGGLRFQPHCKRRHVSVDAVVVPEWTLREAAGG